MHIFPRIIFCFVVVSRYWSQKGLRHNEHIVIRGCCVDGVVAAVGPISSSSNIQHNTTTYRYPISNDLIEEKKRHALYKIRNN